MVAASANAATKPKTGCTGSNAFAVADKEINAHQKEGPLEAGLNCLPVN
jgi:hypothetical protein